MKTGNIILVSNPFWWKRPIDSLLYLLVRLVIGKWHHCAIALLIEGELYICEAKGSGVIVSTYAQWLNRWPSRITQIVDVECESYYIREHWGKNYDRSSFLFYCLVKLATKKWFGRTGDGAADKLYCFEYAALCHQLPGWYAILPQEFVSLLRDR